MQRAARLSHALCLYFAAACCRSIATPPELSTACHDGGHCLRYIRTACVHSTVHMRTPARAARLRLSIPRAPLRAPRGCRIFVSPHSSFGYATSAQARPRRSRFLRPSVTVSLRSPHRNHRTRRLAVVFVPSHHSFGSLPSLTPPQPLPTRQVSLPACDFCSTRHQLHLQR